jgi:hypothetical protein
MTTTPKERPDTPPADVAEPRDHQSDAPPVSTAQEISDLTESDMVTVLYNYGNPAVAKHQYLGGLDGIVKFERGVAKNIPLRVARAWQKGINTDGRPCIPTKVILLRNDAVEADYVAVTGLSDDPISPERAAVTLRGMSMPQLIQLLGHDDAVLLVEELAKTLGMNVSSAFKGGRFPNR